MSDMPQRLSKLRAQFSRLKAPDAFELSMSTDELKQLLGEIRSEGRTLVDQLQNLAKSGKEPGLVNEVVGRLERALVKLKSQEEE